MWSELTRVGGITNTVTMPTDGIISIVKPEGTELCAYVNGQKAPLHHLHVNSGDSVYFELEGHGILPGIIEVHYGGQIHSIPVVTEAKYDQYIAPIPVQEPILKEIKHELRKLKHLEKEMTPAETVNLFAGMGNQGSGMGAGAGAGLGAGLLGGILGGALLGKHNGILGGDNGGNVEGIVTPALLSASLANVTDTQMNTAVLQTLGDIKASIPYAESQMQLALAVAQADINRSINNGEDSVLAGQAGINKNISDAIATSLASQSAIKETVLTTASANLTATLNSKYELSQNIRDDGDKTRALLIAQNEANLQRQLAVAENALLEQRAIGRSREVEVNVTQNVNQNQAQLQQQQQQQQQFLVTNNLLQAILCQAQVAQATNQNLIIGNTGAVHGGAQTANPVNVRA